jgi:phosphatidate cytidylyltransferase
VAGQFGDLFASCLKRSADLKDFSETLPGHGGVLDRLDSVLLCSPVVLAFCILALS